MDLQKSEGETQTVPPEVHPTDVEQNGINLVNIVSGQVLPKFQPEVRDRQVPSYTTTVNGQIENLRSLTPIVTVEALASESKQDILVGKTVNCRKL